MKILLLATLVVLSVGGPASARDVHSASYGEVSPERPDIAAGREGGQTPPPAPTAPPAQNPQSAPSPPPNYKYSAEGRRDPFVSLVNRGTTDPRQGQAARVRPEGLAGLLIDEIVVKGIFESRGVHIATVSAPNGKSYPIRAGDRLMDGVVKSITPQAVILMQEVNDPLSLEKQREVKKSLRGEVK